MKINTGISPERLEPVDLRTQWHIPEDFNFDIYIYIYITTLWTFIQSLYVLGHPNSLIVFHSNVALYWQFNVAKNTKTYLGPLVKRPILTEFGIPRHIFVKIRNIVLTEIRPVGAALIHADRQTDRQTDGT